MSIDVDIRLRRRLTVILAVAAAAVGFAAIRAAAAWTAEAAPLVASPPSAGDHARSTSPTSRRASADLEAQLAQHDRPGRRDDGRPAAAQDRIADDAAHADQLADDLAAARKIASRSLEASIKACARPRTVTPDVDLQVRAVGELAADHDGEHESRR